MIELNEEQRIILNTARQIAQEKIRPRAAEIDANSEFPWDTVKVFTENGLLTPILPEKYGGIGAGYLLFARIIEEISKVCASSALVLIAQAESLPFEKPGRYLSLISSLPAKRIGSIPSAWAMSTGTTPTCGCATNWPRGSS